MGPRMDWFRIVRYTIPDAEHGDEPRTRHELNAVLALGAILNKRSWFTKWTTQPTIRDKWLLEIEDALVKANVASVWAEWPRRYRLSSKYEVTKWLVDAANLDDEALKCAEIERLLADVLYPPAQFEYDAFGEGEQYGSEDEEGEGGYETEDEEAEEEAEEEEEDAEEEEEEDRGDGEEGDEGDEGDKVKAKETDDESAKDGGVEEEDKEDVEAGDGAEEDEEDQEDDDDDEDDEEEEGGDWYEASAIDTDFDTVYIAHDTKNPFCQIAWYVAMSVVRDELRGLAPAEWTTQEIHDRTEAIWSPKNQLVVTRACELILTVIRGDPCTMETIQSHFPSEERRNVLKLLQLHFLKVKKLLKTTKRDIGTVLKLTIKKLKLLENKLPKYSPGPAPQTWLSDDCIPAQLKTKFVSEIAVLENVPDQDKDWHPHTENQVLDLVHPSLFCGVAGHTVMLAESDTQDVASKSSAAAHLKSIMFAETPRTLEKTSQMTDFQWLPCEIDVSEDGESAAIRTYINNLHPEDHASLYESIGAIFTQFVPLFDQVVASLDDDLIRRMDDYYSTSGREVKTLVAKALTEELGRKPRTSLRRLTPTTLCEYDTPRFTLKGRRCQVIVKIAEIVLTPEKPEYAGGSWHVEGTDAERIVATGLYYFGCDNITESLLSFRTIVHAPEYEQSDHLGVALAYGLINEEVLVQNLGSVTAMEDRCVVFPNILQHEVQPFKLADPTKPGVRKILAFFLVDPMCTPIISTAIVPPQQQQWVQRDQEPALKKLRIPDSVVGQIQNMARERMSLEQAKEYRLKLMDERSPEEDGDDVQMLFSLCEH